MKYYTPEHHSLDIHPIPREKQPMYINEPWLIDKRWKYGLANRSADPDDQPDNIRVYIPFDINRKAIIERLRGIIVSMGAASEKNESEYASKVDKLISQIEIYDQIWYVRHIPKDGSKHSQEAKDLVREFCEVLLEIPDECAETFPFWTIQGLYEEFLPEEKLPDMYDR